MAGELIHMLASSSSLACVWSVDHRLTIEHSDFSSWFVVRLGTDRDNSRCVAAALFWCVAVAPDSQKTEHLHHHGWLVIASDAARHVSMRL